MSRSPKRKAERGETIASYDVGKGKTDPGTRWKPGCASPNPKGRPRKAKTGQRKLDHFLDHIVEVPGSDGTIERLTKRELAYLQIANMAAKGNLAAFRVVVAHDQSMEGRGGDALLFDPELTERLLKGMDAAPVAGQTARRRTRKKPGDDEARQS